MILGVTGGIGAGKSLVCEVFSHLGIACYNSDDRAKALLNHNPELKEEVIQLLGEDAYDKGLLNRSFVAQRVFGNSELLEGLNALVHPRVKRDFESWQIEQDSKFVIKEAAILIESGAYQQCDQILVVTAPKELRINRVLARDGADRASVEARMNKQLDEEERLSHANFVIKNDEQQMLVPQVIEVYQYILNQIELNEL